MATSGSWDYNLTAATLIAAAFEDLQVVIPGGTVASADSALALVRLNLIAKQYGILSSGLNMQPIQRQRVTLMLAKGQQTYTIGPAATDSRASISVGRTTISADEAAAQTVISITSNTDTTSYPGTTITMASGDFVGIELNDGTIQWTTISGSPAATMTIAVALTSAASAGNKVFWFTSRAQRIPTVESIVLRDENLRDVDLPAYEDVRQYELGVADKNADGRPTVVLVENLRLNTRLTLDTQPTDVTDTLVITGLYPAEDYDATSNDIALPQEGLLALTWALAKLCAPAMTVVWTPLMESNYTTAMTNYRNLNPETSVLYFQPNA